MKVWPRVVVLSLVALVATFGAWDRFLAPHFVAKNFDVVEPGIYRAGLIDAGLLESVVKEHGVRRIVTLLPERRNDPRQQEEARIANVQGIRIERFPLHGNGTGDPMMYVRAVQAIVEAHRADEPVLVHCAAGAQRTGGVIALYRVVQGKSGAEIVDEMKRHGLDPRKNAALLPYLNSNMAFFVEELHARGVLERVPASVPQLPVG